MTRELFRRAGVKVSTVTVRKALREAGIERLKPLRRAGERAAVQGAAPTRYGYTTAHRRRQTKTSDDRGCSSVIARSAAV